MDARQGNAAGLSAGDARSLPADALEELRRKAVAAVESGLPQTQVARAFGVSRKAVGSWVRAYRSGGESAFRSRPRGRRSGERLALSAEQQAWVVRAVATGAPDELGLPSLLWTRRAIAELILDQFGIPLAGATVDKYLLRWELTGQGAAVSRWPYDCPPGTLAVSWTYPRPPGSAHRVNALVAISNRGLLYFVAHDRPFTADMLAAFRKRLRIQFTRDVRLMVCAWPDAQSTLLTNWREMDPKMAVR